MATPEFRVRPVTRYIVTRYTSESRDGAQHIGLETLGEFCSEKYAEQVAEALRGKPVRAQLGDVIKVDGMDGEIWAVHEWPGRRLFDVSFPGTSRNSARVEDTGAPYSALTDNAIVHEEPAAENAAVAKW